MENNILPGEPSVDTISQTPTTDAATSAGMDPKYRRLFSVAIVGFAIWYFGFRKKRGAK